MKLEVVQGLWPASPLALDLEVVLALETPASVWTGANDGKIIRWNVDSWSSPKNIYPSALLCGHTAGIVGLKQCVHEKAKAVVSVCIEGGLCIWDSLTGQCLRRRRLPPLVLHPTSVTTVAGFENYICVGYMCSSVQHEDFGKETPVDDSDSSGQHSPRNSSAKTAPKGGILIVDTGTLTVTQNVYHGYLGTGEIKDVVVVPEDDDCRVVAVDTQGRVHVWYKLRIQQEHGKSNKAQKQTVFGSVSDLHQFHTVSLSSDGNYVLLVQSSGWLLKGVEGSIIFQEHDAASLFSGGYFFTTTTEEQLLVWKRDGSAVIYTLQNSDSSPSVTPLCHVAAGSIKCQGIPKFCSLPGVSVRLDSDQQATKLTLWACSLANATFLGDGKLCMVAFDHSSGHAKFQDSAGIKRSIGTDEFITTSMVVPTGSQAPSMLVCGYQNGEIQLVKFRPSNSFCPPLRLLQHTDSVLCLALHHSDFKQVLLSGSKDGSVCIWDLQEGGKLLAALPHHVAPVRHFVLPSRGTSTPWDQCFVSVGDDGCAALASLSTLRTERLFPGHGGAIKEVVWDESRAYLAVLCTQAHRDSLYIWDVHSGARERIVRGAPALATLKHFVGKRKVVTATQQLPTNNLTSASSLSLSIENQADPRTSAVAEQQSLANGGGKKSAVRAGCPFPGVAAVQFDMSAILWSKHADEHLLKTCLSMLHVWGVDKKLDESISHELDIFEPVHYLGAGGVIGNRGAVTLTMPDEKAMHQLWRSSADFCSTRALAMVSLAQQLVTVSKPGSLICSSLATFYASNVFEKLGGTCQNSLEIYIGFWQDQVEHLRLAARTLFHAAASKAIPEILRQEPEPLEEWLESTEQLDWIGMTNSSFHDRRASRILMSGALSVWYGSLVRDDLPEAVAPFLLKLVRASDKHSATAAEVLSAGMTGTWQPLIHAEIPQLTCDVIHFIGPVMDMTTASYNEGLSSLLPALAASDMAGYLNALRTVATTDSSSFLPGFMALVQVFRTSPLTVIPFLAQLVALGVQVLDPGNSTRRKRSLAFIMQALKEMVRVFPMVALFPSSQAEALKLAVGDPVGDIRSLTIHVYDLQSASILKVLDASGPPGHPALTSGRRSFRTQGISALSFSKDGEGLVAFSHHGLIIRQWSLGAAWWEKLSRSIVPVQCTKLVLVPPSPGFSPKSSNSSMMVTLTKEPESSPELQQQQDREEDLDVDLSFRLQWKSDWTVGLVRGSEEVGSFRL